MEKEILIIIAITLILILVAKMANDNKELKKFKEEKKKQDAILYRYRDYEAPRLNQYIMTDKEKINFLFDNLPDKQKGQLLRYGENLKRQVDTELYTKK